MTASGKGVTARVLASNEHDVIAVEIDDQRQQPAPIATDLRMLRYAIEYFVGKNWELTSHRTVMVEHRDQTAASRLDIREGRIVLVQEFREGDYYNSSAVAIGVAGRKSKASYASDSAVRLAAAPGKGKFTVLIASAASFDPSEDVAAAALKELDAASARGFDVLLASNRQWWHNYWSKAFVHLSSGDGVADYVEQNYTYFLYVMGSASRGKYPPRFGGLLFGTNGDMREWGAQQWWHNLSCYYDAMPPTNRLDIMDPMFAMYSGMYDSLATAAREQWGSQGVYIPETVWFDGLAKLPDNIAAEMRDLYLLRKPWDQRSERFRRYAETQHPHSSRWNWKGPGKWVEGHWVWKDKGYGPYGEVNHIFSSGAKISYLYWLRYLYTKDDQWLRERAYPVLKGIAEFYRNYPKMTKGDDGKYHIHDVNDHEPIKGAQDTLEEMTAMHYIFPTAGRAASILGVDRELQAAWRDVAENLAPLPNNVQPDSLDPRQPGQPKMWTNGRKPVIGGSPTRGSDHLLVPAIHYDFLNVASGNPEMTQVANATFDSVVPGGANDKTAVHVLSRVAIAAAHLGRAGDLRHLVPNQMRSFDPGHDFCDWPGQGRIGVMPNRLTLREGPGAISAQRLGRASAALHLAMLQTVPPLPGEDPVMHVFPAWPKEWDAAFTLLTSGAFLVTSSFRQGKTDFVELHSQAGGECRLRNPWGEQPVTLYRNGEKSEDAESGLLRFSTRKEETIVVVQRGQTPGQHQRTVL